MTVKDALNFLDYHRAIELQSEFTDINRAMTRTADVNEAAALTRRLREISDELKGMGWHLGWVKDS